MSIQGFFAFLFGVDPATGLPMADSTIDIAGSPYGTDLHRHDDTPGLPSCLPDYPHDHYTGSPINNDWSNSS